MKIQLKPIRDQVIVITGASSGIGLVAARQAAECGARVVLAARNENALREAVRGIRANGGRAAYVVTDVAVPQEVERLAETAVQEFGRIDTWVNNAAVSMYGRLVDSTLDDMRRQMDVNYWGQVYGCRAAVPRMRDRSGALINVGSALCDRAIPLQGTYCASKHALKGFTDTLRMELEEAQIPISVTLIKPGSIDTPFYEKARTLFEVEPRPVPPVYAPEVVAGVILHAAEHPLRELVAGGSGVALSAARFAPRLADLYMEKWLFDSQQSSQALTREADNLYAPVADDGGERGGNWKGRTHESSLYTWMCLHPRISTALLATAMLAARVLATSRTKPIGASDLT